MSRLLPDVAGMFDDIRSAARLIVRQPRPALLVIMTMALGIGAATLLFSVAYGVLARPLPWPRGDQLVVIEETRGGRAPRFGSLTNSVYLAWRDRPLTVDGMAAWSQHVATLAAGGEPERILITSASAELFDLLGARPLAGRLFQPGDDVAADGPVVVLSEGLWRGRFGADPAVPGSSVRIDGRTHTIVGVLPDALGYPDHQARAYVPLHVPPATGHHLSMFSAIARLKPGATPAQAAAEATARARAVPDSGMTTMAIFGATGPIDVTTIPLLEWLTAGVRPGLLILLAGAGLLLAAAAGNVAGVQLARATTRRHELALRAALGATSARLSRQLLLENVLLGLIGGCAGLYLAWLLTGMAPALLPADFPRSGHLDIDATGAVFALLVSLLASLVCGVLPALATRRQNLIDSLAGRGPMGFAGRPVTTARRLILAGQAAIACVLLVSGLLLGRSYQALIAADRGYDPSGVLLARLPLQSIDSPERRHAIVDQVLGRLGRLQDAAVGFTTDLPLTPGGSTSAFQIRAPAPRSGMVDVQASPRIVSPGCFSALGLRVAAGRGFAETDTDASQPVVVVNRAFARRYLGDAPLGAELPMGVGYEEVKRSATVVGVIDDVRYLTANDSSQPEIYHSHRQLEGRLPVPVVTLVMRAAGDPESLASEIRAAVREADADLAPDVVTSMEQRIRLSAARPRLYAALLGGFGTASTAIAGVGLFGLLSYTVAQRSKELAVRAALGAGQADLARMVLRQGLAVIAGGCAAGLAVSAALMHWMASLLYGVTPHDPVTYAAAPSVLFLVATIACIVPARRASRFDPVELLRRPGGEV
ncbi:MAG TPA: ADOP family duplicated permease [Candidatus Polarisedimenticolia bacterium]|nr:ADOP family duplicated permease [Candidatus Polarisedimenticolia bacterium]